MGSSVRILSVGGIPVYVHASWLAVYALVTWTLAVGYFPHALPEPSTLAAWLSGLVAALLLFVSVLLHELSHSLVAQAHGLRVRGITLHVFGGVSQLEDEPPSPRAEFRIAAVGPLTSVLIAGLLWVASAGGLVPTGSPRAVVTYLIVVNLAVGIFNLVPGFPLDGGRLLRAALWKWTGALARATAIASRVGGGVAVALMVLGLLQILNGVIVGGAWLVLIGLFLRGAADASHTQVALREALRGLAVRTIMTRDVVTIGPDATVTDLVDAFWTHHVGSFPVVEGDAVVGIASLQHVPTVARDRWPTTRVREVMRPVSEDLLIGPDDDVQRALERAARNELGRLAVVERGRLVGYLSLKDITHVLVLRGVEPAPRPLVGAGDLRRAA